MTSDSAVPRPLAIAWGLDVAPTRGPRRELSHDEIVAAAIRLADAGGLTAVTMARVAEAVGFTTMSLYRYVASKDELVALMADAAAALPDELPVTDDDWRQGLRDVAQVNLDLYERHPWFLDVPLSLQGVLMPNSLRIADATYRAMRTLPADAAFKQNVLVSLSMFCRAFGQLRRDLGGPADPAISPDAAALLAGVITPERYPDLAPAFHAGAYLGDDPEDRDTSGDFAMGLELFLDGLEAHLARSR